MLFFKFSLRQTASDGETPVLELEICGVAFITITLSSTMTSSTC